MRFQLMFLSCFLILPVLHCQDAIFLHHSTGGGVLNEGDVLAWIADYNSKKGTAYKLTTRPYPHTPYPWSNYPYDYWNLWINGACDNGDPDIACLDKLASEYDVIVFKHCYPGSQILANTGTPAADSEIKTLENYKVQYRALRARMDEFPQTRFIVWTLVPLHRLSTNEGNAARAREFVNWVKGSWLTEDGQSHPNIYIFDFFELAAESNPDPLNGSYNCLRYEYEKDHDSGDSHPNTIANQTIGPLFAEFIVRTIEDQPLSGGDVNPYVADALLDPAPIHPLEVEGKGTGSFVLGNSGRDALEYADGQELRVEISLSGGLPDGEPIAALGGDFAELFDWTFSGGQYTGIQNSTLPAGAIGEIAFRYRVTENSDYPGNNGFHVGVFPASTQISGNDLADDTISFFTFTELRDYGDAPASYGDASHTVDFRNYFGNGWIVDDGITMPGSMSRGEQISLGLSVSGQGIINAWMDWNGDGDFEDSDERVLVNFNHSGGYEEIQVSIPSQADTTGVLWARFRLSTQGLESSSGHAYTGEVEDYSFRISCIAPEADLYCSDPDLRICEGDELVFTASGGVSYIFRENGQQVQSGNADTYTTSELSDMDLIDVVVLDEYGCKAVSQGIIVKVESIPKLIISDPPGVCAPLSVDLTAASVTEGSTDGISLSYWQDASAETELVHPESVGKGIYYISGRNTITGCQATKAVEAIVYPSPLSPVMSEASIHNSCPASTVNLFAQVVSPTPEGSLLRFFLNEVPGSQLVPDPYKAEGGNYYVFYQSNQGCYSEGSRISVSIDACPPDLHTSMTVEPAVLHGKCSFRVFIRVSEENAVFSDGIMRLYIPSDERWIIKGGFNPSLTSIDGIEIDNNSWSYSYDDLWHVFTSSTQLAAGASSTLGFEALFDPGDAHGVFTITSQLLSGEDSELRINNNVVSRDIEYYQE